MHPGGGIGLSGIGWPHDANVTMSQPFFDDQIVPLMPVNPRPNQLRGKFEMPECPIAGKGPVALFPSSSLADHPQFTAERIGVFFPVITVEANLVGHFFVEIVTARHRVRSTGMSKTQS